MKTIKLQPKLATLEVLSALEDKEVIALLKPTALIAGKINQDASETIYSSLPAYGTHKLLCVRKNNTKIKLTVHPDNEEFIAINLTDEIFKPLYLIIAGCKRAEFEKKVTDGVLTGDDLYALELQYNSSTSVFTVLQDVPHCEVTVLGADPAPVFFVTEPTDLTMSFVKQDGFNFCLN